MSSRIILSDHQSWGILYCGDALAGEGPVVGVDLHSHGPVMEAWIAVAGSSLPRFLSLLPHAGR